MASSDSPLDLSSEPGFWGGRLRGFGGTLVGRAPLDYAVASDADAAREQVLAALVAYLSCVGRESLDAYMLPMTASVGPSQLDGALAALAHAQTEGIVAHTGLWALSPERAACAILDGIDLLLVNDAVSLEAWKPVTEERGVGVVLDLSDGSEGWARGLPYHRIRRVASEADLEGLA